MRKSRRPRRFLFLQPCLKWPLPHCLLTFRLFLAFPVLQVYWGTFKRVWRQRCALPPPHSWSSAPNSTLVPCTCTSISVDFVVYVTDTGDTRLWPPDFPVQGQTGVEDRL